MSAAMALMLPRFSRVFASDVLRDVYTPLLRAAPPMPLRYAFSDDAAAAPLPPAAAFTMR